MELIRRAVSSIFCTRLEDSDGELSFFLKNGSKLLEELIARWDGRSKIPLRNFSAKELAKATDNFDFHGLVYEDSNYRTFRGSFEKRQILVKKYVFRHDWEQRQKSFFVRDIVISSQMSFHKNVLKLIGYCLDFEYPTLIYQSPEAYVCLTRHLSNTEELKLTWKNRLSIALDIANVLAYLHTGFRTPIIHRNLKLAHIVLDEYGTAKFVDFSFCILIPLGECQVEDVIIGTIGYLDPEYAATGVLTVKTDVYNFGVVLIELFTGKRYFNINYSDNFSSWFDFLRSYIMTDKIEDIVNGDLVTEGETGQHEQLRACAALALKCTGLESESRPEMVDIAKELRRIQRLASSSSTS